MSNLRQRRTSSRVVGPRRLFKSEADKLAGRERQGLFLDFTTRSVKVGDDTTAANRRNSYSHSGFQTTDPITSFLTYTASSLKTLMGPYGVLYTTTAGVLPYQYTSAGVLEGIRAEEARTNLCIYSDDLTNAAWVKTTMNTAKTAIGPDGVTNSATTITATAANATVLQSITSASAARITSCYIKRRTGTGTVEMTQDNGSTWAAVTVTSGWTRVNIAAATLTNPIVGLRVVTDTDAVDVALFDHEVGSLITSPIPTVASTVTRAADNITLAVTSFPYSATDLTLFGEGITATGNNSAGQNQSLASLDDASLANYRRVYTNDTTVAYIEYNGSRFETVTKLPVSSAIKAALAVTPGNNAACWNGGTVETDAGTASVTGITVLRFGALPADLRFWNSVIKRILVVPRRMSNAELVTLTR